MENQNIKIEANNPDDYEQKSSFETEEEYCKRHLFYGYVKVGEFELNGEDYDINNKKFQINLGSGINCKEIKGRPYIEIGRDEAKDLYADKNNKYIYEKFVDTKKGFSLWKLLGLKDKLILKKTLSIIHHNKIYILKSNDLILMIEHNQKEKEKEEKKEKIAQRDKKIEEEKKEKKIQRKREKDTIQKQIVQQ